MRRIVEARILAMGWVIWANNSGMILVDALTVFRRRFARLMISFNKEVGIEEWQG